jgi:hypothetical protein
VANRVFNYTGDVTPPTITADLMPPFEGMELLYPEIEVFRGDTATVNFAVTQNGQPFNLSGYAVLYQGKNAIGDLSPVFNETATITDAPNGKCTVTLSGTDLAVAATLTTQLYLTLAGTTQTVLQIPLVIQPSV